MLKVIAVIFLFLQLSNHGLFSVLLTDLNNICSETNGGSHVLPGMEVVLLCDVNFTSNGSYNVLTWTLPVKGESENVDISHTNKKLYRNYSIYSSTATFKGDSAHATLTFIAIQSLDDQVVTCKDSSKFSDICTLLINTIPNTPTNLSNTSVTYHSMSISWNVPSDTGGCDIVNYIITVTNSSNPRNITTTDNTTSYTVNELMSGQSYSFTVRANNCIGLGEKSNVISITPPAIAIPTAPLSVTIVNVTYQSVSLSWTFPSDIGGYNIVNYIINVIPLDGSDPWSITTTDNSTSYIVTGLMFGQKYNFTVRASNRLGVGGETSTMTVTLLGEVLPPVHVKVCLNYHANDTTELTVSWTPRPPVISNTDAIPPVDNYTIFINGSFLEITRCSHIQSVDEGIYTVSVTANNIVGSSEKTTIYFNARWLQNIDVNVTELKVVYTTADCVVRDDFTVQLVYNNDTNNILITTTKSYVSNTTDSFILSSLQPGATISYTLQVIDTDGNTVGSSRAGSFIPLSPSSPAQPTSSPRPILLYIVISIAALLLLVIIAILVKFLKFVHFMEKVFARKEAHSGEIGDMTKEDQSEFNLGEGRNVAYEDPNSKHRKTLSMDLNAVSKGPKQPLDTSISVNILNNNLGYGNKDKKMVEKNMQRVLCQYLCDHNKWVSKLKGKNTDPQTANTDPQEADSVPHETDIDPQVTDPAPQEADIDPQITDPVSQETDTVPQETDPVPQETDTVPQETNTFSQETDIDSQVTDPAPQEADIDPQVTDPAPQEADIDPQVTDPVSQDTDTVPQETDPVPQETDTVPQETNTFSQETDIDSQDADTRPQVVYKAM